MAFPTIRESMTSVRAAFLAMSSLRRATLAVAVVYFIPVNTFVVASTMAAGGFEGLRPFLHLPVLFVTAIVASNSLFTSVVIVELLRLPLGTRAVGGAWSDPKHFAVVSVVWVLLFACQFWACWHMRHSALRESPPDRAIASEHESLSRSLCHWTPELCLKDPGPKDRFS
jgi:hypothetical protein